MKLLTVSYDDGPAGAGRAAHRLHRALLEQGVDASMRVARKNTDDPRVSEISGLLSQKAVRALGWFEVKRGRILRRPGTTLFSPATLSMGWSRVLQEFSADLVHLHWINAGLLSPEDLVKIRRPVVWTLHDMWPFTGGCHYAGDCERYRDDCRPCPILRANASGHLANSLLNRKHEAFANVDLTIVSPSRWLARCAAESALFAGRRIDVIPNAVDLSIFRPHKKAEARSRLGLDPDRPVLLVAAVQLGDKRKGADLLLEALARMQPRMESERPTLLVIGGRIPPEFEQVRHMDVRATGVISGQDEMALHLAAADLCALPSREENLSNFIAESLGCGVPVAAFDIGGNSDLIKPGESGALAPAFDVEAYAACMDDLLDQSTASGALSASCRALAEQTVDSNLIARRHRDLYAELLADKGDLDVDAVEARRQQTNAKARAEATM